MSGATCPFRTMVTGHAKPCVPSCAYRDGGGCGIRPRRVQAGRICPMTEANASGVDCSLKASCALKKSIAKGNRDER